MNNLENLSTQVSLVEHNIQPQGIPLNDPKAVTKTSKQDLVALASEIEKADNFVKTNTYNKLQVIVEQIKSLKKQAEDILVEANWNMKLHHVACNFVKQPGHIYHLYKRESGQFYFSMINPEEWGNSGPAQIYKGSFRLEHDHTWTPLHETNNKNLEITLLDKLWSNSPTATFECIDSNINT